MAIQKLKSILANSEIFWRLRHIIQPKIWTTYLYSESTHRDYYKNFIIDNHVKTVFEFGCASGPNLKYINENVDSNISLLGYDINTSAVKLGQVTLTHKRVTLINRLNKNWICTF